MNDKNAHSYTEAGYYENTEAANYTTEEQFGTVPKEIKKENIYLDLSKLSEEERKEVYFLFPKECFNAVKITLYYQYLHLKDWFTSLFNHDKTEISLSQFKELFQTSAEDAQVENEDYPGKRYQPLFDHLNSEHGLILFESEMDEIIRIVHEL